MIISRDEIDEKLQAIQLEINQAFQANLDTAKLKNLSLKILDLSGDIVTYLNSLDLLSPWVKSHIVGAINSLNWGWLYAAVNHLLLAICELDEVSPGNVYRAEITNLNLDEIMDHIVSFKRNLEKM